MSEKPDQPETEIAVIAAMARDAEWLCADACAFTLGMVTPKGKLNRRGFLERIAVKGSFPRPVMLDGQKRWRRQDVMRWMDDEARIAQKAA